MSDLERVGGLDRSNRLRFQFGARVTGKDRALGGVRQVCLDPDTLQVVGVGMRTGLLPRSEVKLPLVAVVSAVEDEVRLCLTASEVAKYRAVQAKLPHRPSADRGSFRPAVMHEGLRLRALDGTGGVVRQVVVDAGTHAIEELVVELGLFSPRLYRVPGEWVRGITPDAILVDASFRALRRLPEYRSDREIRADILDTWFWDELLRPALLETPVDVQVREGSVTLEGYADSPEQARRLEGRALAVAGVREVRSALVVAPRPVYPAASASRMAPRPLG